MSRARGPLCQGTCGKPIPISRATFCPLCGRPLCLSCKCPSDMCVAHFRSSAQRVYAERIAQAICWRKESS